MTKKDMDDLIKSIPFRLDLNVVAGAAATTAVDEEESTGIGIGNEMVMFITHWTVQPQSLQAGPVTTNNLALRFQLQDREEPAAAALMLADDSEELGTIDLLLNGVTSGGDNGYARTWTYPLTCPGPFITGKSKITAAVDASGDDNAINSAAGMVWIFKVYYHPIEASDALLARMALMRGLR